MHGDGHQAEPEPAVPGAGRITVEAVAVVGDGRADAVIDGGEPDGDFGGPGVLKGVAECLLGCVVKQGSGGRSYLGAMMQCLPPDRGSLMAQGVR